MNDFALKGALDAVRQTSPLVHCITNYVTVNECANALLALGASPIMSDEPADVADITSICNALVLNIGTLNQASIEGMRVAGATAADLSHPIVLDPVGAGASALRTQVAGSLLDTLPVAVVRGNMSEIKALAGASATTRGVDVNPHDVVDDENLAQSVEFARAFATQAGVVAAITGAIDIVTAGAEAYLIRNGSPWMGRMTGCGCVLTCLAAAFVAANADDPCAAAAAAVAFEGLCGQIAAARLGAGEGTGSFRTYLLDAITCTSGDALEEGALIQVMA